MIPGTAIARQLLMRHCLSVVAALLLCTPASATPGGAPQKIPGSYTRLGATMRAIRDPNRAEKPTLVRRQPALNRLHALLIGLGVGKKTAIARLRAFVEEREAEWSAGAGEPVHVTTLTERDIPEIDLFRAQKALSLKRYQRRPGEVIDDFFTAEGTVSIGEPIKTRKIFYQTWLPRGTPRNEVHGIMPGFFEDGRDYHERAVMLSDDGVTAEIMDQQWAGYTQGGSRGGIDRGFGISRDGAAFAAHLAKKYPGAKIVIEGVSMGGGPGVIGATTLNDSTDLLKLKGDQMPKGTSGLAESPYLGTTDNLTNRGLGVLAKIPGVNRLPLPNIGLPLLTHDRTAQVKIADHAAMGGTVGQPRALNAAAEDLATLRALLTNGQRPKGNIFVLKAAHDPLASPEATDATVKLLDPAKTKLRTVDSNNHVFEQGSQDKLFLEGVNWLRDKK
jgi:hypothetical protein